MFTKTATIAHVGLLVAISIILTRFFSMMIPIGGALGLRISFGEIPLMLSGILFGPLTGAFAGIIADLVGVALLPMGTFFPGFTLSSALTGALPGLILKILYNNHDKLGIKQLSIVVVFTNLIVSIFLNSTWLVIMYQLPLNVLLPTRFLAQLIMVPLYTIILSTVYKSLQGFIVYKHAEG